MPYIRKDEEYPRLIFVLLLIFFIYNFILAPLGFLKIPAIVSADFFSLVSRGKKPLPREIKDIIVVAVDNDTLTQVGLQWPWNRSIHAELLKKISSGGPKAIFLDFAFTGKANDEASDTRFAEALKQAGNVILAGYLERGEYVKPLAMLASSARAVGFVNKKDFRAHGAQEIFLVSSKDKIFEHGVEVKILAQAKGLSPADIRYDADKIILAQGLSIPIDEFGVIPIHYAAGVSDFTTIPAYKVLDPATDTAVFRDKIVMVGMTADIGQDIHDTLFGEIPGIYINANTMLMLLSGDFLKKLPYAHENFKLFTWMLNGRLKEALPYVCSLSLFLLFTLAAGLLSLRFKALYSALFVAVILYGVSIGYLVLQIRYNFHMDIFSIFFLSLISYGGVEAYKYIVLLIGSEKLKISAITDQATGMYTQRYFQLTLEAAITKSTRSQRGFFGFLRINEFSELAALSSQGSVSIIKILSDVVKEYCGQGVLLARYGEDTLSLCILQVNRKKAHKVLLLLIKEIMGRDFVIENNALRLSVKMAAVPFPLEHIRNYSDLVLTSEFMLKRIASEAQAPLAIFDPKVDKVVRVTAPLEAVNALPKGELAYVSMDLEARNKELEAALEELKKQQRKIDQAYFETMHSLVKALEQKDPYTSGHSERVSMHAAALASELHLPDEEIEVIRKAAYLHDIGKIGLPDRVLHKKEKLSDEDFDYVKRHQSDGAKILEGLPFYKEIVQDILYHHERYDGKGYPHGLSGDMIPRGAQVIAIADAYDAMTTGRGYNNPLSVEEAARELKKSSGQQFNPAYIDIFIKLLEQKKIHSL